ncbi:MAG: hypothetical protein U0271_33445 [Polyangiaceae bacterium]
MSSAKPSWSSVFSTLMMALSKMLIRSSKVTVVSAAASAKRL